MLNNYYEINHTHLISVTSWDGELMHDIKEFGGS